jgi:hypothetical protein
MTVNSATATASYLGNGATQLFPVPFYFLADTDLKVSFKSAATGAVSVLTLNSQYTLNGAGDPSGGTLTMLAVPAPGDQLFIERNLIFVQQTAYPENNKFPSASHEKALDRDTMGLQQLDARLARALIRDPLGSTYDLGAASLINGAPGVGGTDIPTMAQVIELVGDTTITNSPFTQAGAGAVTRTMLDKNQETVSVLDFGADKTGVTDSTAKIQAALNTGKSVYFPDGVYTVQQLVLSASGVRLYGSGLIKKKANVDGMCLRITGSKNLIDALNFDATAPQPSLISTNDNDVVRIEGSDNIVRNCYINGSKGGGIAILNAARNQILFNTVLNVYNNSILVANVGADDNLIVGNYCDGTGVQNNIFLSARTSGIGTTDYIYRNRVIGNTCKNSGDTAIEMGQHNRECLIQGNYVTGIVNPPILIRDSIDWVVSGNVVECGVGVTDGIAAVPQGEAATFPSRGIIADNRISGKVTRSFIYVGNYDTKVLSNYISDTVTVVNAGGTNMVGAGIAVAGSLNNIEIRGNSIDSVASGVATNIVVAALDNFICSENSIKATIKSLNFDSTTFTNSQIIGNVLNRSSTSGINLVSSTGSLSSYMARNTFALGGFVGATPVKFNATFAVQQSFLASETEQVATVPVTQFDYRVLVPLSTISTGILTLEFATGEYSIMVVFAQGGTGDGNSYAAIKTHAGITMDITGSTNWGITKTSEGIIIQRRGTTIAAYGSFKWRFDPVTQSL